MKTQKRDSANEGKVIMLTKRLVHRSPITRAHELEFLVKKKHPDAFKKLLESLSDKNAVVRVTAVEGLGALKNQNGVAPLLDKLSDHSVEVRMRAAESLSILLKGNNSPQTLVESLRDKNDLVRIAVIESLAAIGDRKALPELFKTLKDESPLVRSYAADAIGVLGDKKHIAILEKRLKKEKSEIAKIGIYLSLYKLGRPKVLDELLSLLQSKNYRVRCAVANSLGELQLKEDEKTVILYALTKALQTEPTVAAKSSIQASLQYIS